MESGEALPIPDSLGIGLGGQETDTIAVRADSPHVGEWALQGVEGMASATDDYKSLRVRVTGVDDDVVNLWGYQCTTNVGSPLPPGELLNETLISSLDGDVSGNTISMSECILDIVNNTINIDEAVPGGSIQLWVDLDDDAHIGGTMAGAHYDIGFLTGPDGILHEELYDTVTTPGLIITHDEVYFRAYNTTASATYTSVQDYKTSGQVDAGQITIADGVRGSPIENDWTTGYFLVEATGVIGEVTLTGTTFFAGGSSGATLQGGITTVDSLTTLDLIAQAGLLTIDAGTSLDIDAVSNITMDATSAITITSSASDITLDATSSFLNLAGSVVVMSGTSGITALIDPGSDFVCTLGGGADMFDVQTGGYGIDSVPGDTLADAGDNLFDRGLWTNIPGYIVLQIDQVRVNGVLGINSVRVIGEVV
ncbi:MAG: hypothetical protein KAJ19_08885 [Gammaproteobacteria bacterium]|nr:hypothetical protein [Gammaproteobacteria bacterium]